MLMTLVLSPGDPSSHARDHDRELAGLKILRQHVGHASLVREQFEAPPALNSDGSISFADGPADGQRIADLVAAEDTRRSAT